MYRLFICLIIIHLVLPNLCIKLNPTFSRVISTFSQLKAYILHQNNQQTKTQDILISQIIESSRFSKGLYLSNYATALDKQTIQKKKIGAILTVAKQLSPPVYKDVKSYKINLQDNLNEELSIAIQKAFKFISENINQTNVLVHCKQGISRSATIVIAYLMQAYKLPLSQALQKVKQKRSIINPNKDFIKQLQKFNTSLGMQKDHKQLLKHIIHKKSDHQSHLKRFNMQYNKFMNNFSKKLKYNVKRSEQKQDNQEIEGRSMTILPNSFLQ